MPSVPDHDVHLVLERGSRHRAPATRPERAGAVRLVHHHARVMAPRQLHYLRQRRDVAVHREHAVRHDQRGAAGRLAQAVLEVLDVAVVVDERARLGEPAAVDDARVVEGVRQHHVTLARQRGDDARVGQVARAEQHAGLARLEVRQLRLEPPVHSHVARHEPRRPRADAPAHRRFRRRLAHARVIGEPEVVVRAQEQDRLAVEQHARPLRARHEPHAPVEPAAPSGRRASPGCRSCCRLLP